VEQVKNLTLRLPADLIRKSKVYAAQRDTSINTIVKELLEQVVSGEDKVRAAGARILAIARRGPGSRVDPGLITREEMHERR
jgi:plasmid stability protein